MNLILRIVRLPLDLILLTSDFIRYSIWRLQGLARKCKEDSEGKPHACFRQHKCDRVRIGEKSQFICQCSRYYGNHVLIRMLIPGIRRTHILGRGAFQTCGARTAPRLTLIGHYVGTAVVLLLAWGVLALAVTEGFRQIQGIRDAHGSYAFRRKPIQKTREPLTPGQASRVRKFVASGNQYLAETNYLAAKIEFMNALQRDENNVDAYVGIGRLSDELGLSADAYRAFQKAIELNPESFEALMGQARLELDQRSARRAAELAGQALEIRPHNVDAWLFVSDCHLELDDLNAAGIAAMKALERNPTDVEALLAAANIQLRKRNLDEAKVLYDKVITIRPKSSEAFVGLTRVKRYAGNTDEAVEDLQQFLEGRKGDLIASEELGSIYVQQRKLVQAIHIYSELIETHPDLPHIRARLAELHIKTGRINEGYQVLQELVRRNPDNIAGHLILADMFLNSGLASLAVEHSKRALEQDMRVIPAHKLLALAYMSQGEYEKATRQLEHLLGAVPGDLEARVRLGECYEAQGKTEEAGEQYRSAMVQHPESEMPLTSIARIEIRKGDYGAAIEKYEQALEINPRNTSALNNLAVLLLEERAELEGSIGRALEFAHRAWQINPQAPELADTLGWAYHMNGQNEVALGMLAYAVKQRPANPVGRYHIGAVLYDAGAHGEAQQHLEAALAFAPKFSGSEEAKQLLRAIAQQARSSE